MPNELKLFSGNAHRPLAEEIAQHLERLADSVPEPETAVLEGEAPWTLDAALKGSQSELADTQSELSDTKSALSDTEYCEGRL